MDTLPWLTEDPTLWPDPAYAMNEPNGLLAAGGDLSPDRLLNAYCLGIFPWFSEGEPILWWSPTPRAIVIPNEYKPSKSLKKLHRKGIYDLKINQAFESVIRHCASSRGEQVGTWITEEMIEAYVRLHQMGWAHSFETWRDGQLVGGLYGLAIGKSFFGESMFSLESNTSKLAFWHLCEHLTANDFILLDCQVVNGHLLALGANELERHPFQLLLQQAVASPTPSSW